MSLKEKKMKSLAQARQRKRDGESNVIIDMTVNNDDAFLSSFSMAFFLLSAVCGKCRHGYGYHK